MRRWGWILLLASGACPAVEVAGVTFPVERRVGVQPLVLNGAGVREYGLLGLDVYAAALYLPATQTDARVVLGAPGPKLLVMHLFHGASTREAGEAWAPYFTANCAAPCVLPRAQLAAFNAMLPGTRKGDVQTYLFEDDAVTITHNERVVGRVEGGGFARLLLSTWIGEAPTTEALKRALMGTPAR